MAAKRRFEYSIRVTKRRFLVNMALFLVAVGFVGFVGSLFASVWGGVTKGGQRKHSFGLWMLSAFVFFVMLFIGLRIYPVPHPQ